MRTRRRAVWAAVNVSRFALATTFVFSGTVKLIDPLGFQYKIADYARAFNVEAYAPAIAIALVGVALSVAEFLTGINMLFGIRRRVTSLFALWFLLCATSLTAYMALTGMNIDCGCFGDVVTLTTEQTLAKNVVLLACAAVVVWRWRYMFRFISERHQWTISVYSIAFSISLALWCAHRLPLIDFRPYAIGTNLPEAMAQERLLKTNTSPRYADFTIEAEGEDITEEWLTSEGYKFLLIAPNIEETDDGAIDDINALCDYCRAQGYPMLCLTGSGEEAVARWQDNTGAEYPFAWTDGTELKTVVRSNPGLLLLKGGVVVNKWPHTALPDYEGITEPLDHRPEAQVKETGHMRDTLRLLWWFFIPFVAFALIDRMWIISKLYIIGHTKKTNKHEKEDCSR